MLRIAICDDNIEELSQIASLMEEYRKVNRVEYQYMVFHNGFELMSALEKGTCFDIYFLDIIMPNFTGINLAKEIRTFDQKAQIIFFTSSPEFALEGYSVRAFHYLLKPITNDKLFLVLTDALEQMEQMQDLSVVVKSNNGIQKILLSNLIHVEAMGKKVIYHVISGRTIECFDKFSMVCDSLLKEGFFMKPHRSYLVNMNYIDTIGTTEIMLQTGIQIPIAQGKAKELKEIYLTFQMEE